MTILSWYFCNLFLLRDRNTFHISTQHIHTPFVYKIKTDTFFFVIFFFLFKMLVVTHHLQRDKCCPELPFCGLAQLSLDGHCTLITHPFGSSFTSTSQVSLPPGLALRYWPSLMLLSGRVGVRPCFSRICKMSHQDAYPMGSLKFLESPTQGGLLLGWGSRSLPHQR